MSKTHRLMQVMQLLRVKTPPVQAGALAQELGVSLRTLYRDIDSLRGMGAVIDGEAGYGYRLIEDPALPPMMFTTDEIEALVLGLREVMEVGDPVLSEAARSVLAKVNAGLPPSMHHQMQHAVLHAKRFAPRAQIVIDIAKLRAATRQERAVHIDYSDAKGVGTARDVLPLSLVYIDNALMLLAYCELRQDYRAFRVDRIQTCKETGVSFKPKRVPMLREALIAVNPNREPNGKDSQM